LFEAGSRVKGGPTLFVGPFISTLDAADGSAEWNRDENCVQQGFVPIRISLPRLTKTRLLESCGETNFHQPSMRSWTTDH